MGIWRIAIINMVTQNYSNARESGLRQNQSPPISAMFTQFQQALRPTDPISGDKEFKIDDSKQWLKFAVLISTVGVFSLCYINWPFVWTDSWKLCMKFELLKSLNFLRFGPFCICPHFWSSISSIGHFLLITFKCPFLILGKYFVRAPLNFKSYYCNKN